MANLRQNQQSMAANQNAQPISNKLAAEVSASQHVLKKPAHVTQSRTGRKSGELVNNIGYGQGIIGNILGQVGLQGLSLAHRDVPDVDEDTMVMDAHELNKRNGSDLLAYLKRKYEAMAAKENAVHSFSNQGADKLPEEIE